jgi:hypothetical protein
MTGKHVKHVTLTFYEKMEVIKHKKDNPALTQNQIVDWIEETMDKRVSRAAVSKILSSFDETDFVNPNMKRNKAVRHPELEYLLLEWVMDQESGSISDEMLINEAKDIAFDLKIPESGLSFSSGWLYSFKKRHNIRRHNRGRKSKSADQSSPERTQPSSGPSQSTTTRNVSNRIPEPSDHIGIVTHAIDSDQRVFNTLRVPMSAADAISMLNRVQQEFFEMQSSDCSLQISIIQSLKQSAEKLSVQSSPRMATVSSLTQYGHRG